MVDFLDTNFWYSLIPIVMKHNEKAVYGIRIYSSSQFQITVHQRREIKAAGTWDSLSHHVQNEELESNKHTHAHLLACFRDQFNLCNLLLKYFLFFEEIYISSM